MKLPNGDRAIVDIAKLTDYCLNPHHPRGRNKARVFAAIGIGQSDAEKLRSALLAAAAAAEATSGDEDLFGQRYTIDFDLTVNDRVVKIRSSWMLRTAEELPRLTTCYVL